MARAMRLCCRRTSCLRLGLDHTSALRHLSIYGPEPLVRVEFGFASQKRILYLKIETRMLETHP
jgi:hypothetical protein